VSCATHRLDGDHIVTITIAETKGQVIRRWPE